jgi:hypothetical protein
LLRELLDDQDTIDVEMAATGLLALVLGIGAERAADRTVPGTILADALRAIIGR